MITGKNPARQRGITLIELMIAMLLALVLTAAVITTFTQNKQSFNQDENIQRMQDDARYALREIAFDLSMAGYVSDILIGSAARNDDSLTIATDCGPAGEDLWMYQLMSNATGESLSVTAVDNATGGSASASYSCIDGGEVQPGTDIVAIKRVSGARTAVPEAGTVYLRSNGTIGLLYQEPANTPPAINVPPPFSEWRYRPSIYYIRNYGDAPGDGVPTLCRKVLTGGGPAMVTECLAKGIENLQIEYGIDSDGDGNANAFLSAPTVAQMQGAVSARIFLLASTLNVDTAYTSDKTYFVSNAPAYTPVDDKHRRVISTTVGIRNIRSLKLLGF